MVDGNVVHPCRLESSMRWRDLGVTMSDRRDDGLRNIWSHRAK